jgi:hypothetical protein
MRLEKKSLPETTIKELAKTNIGATKGKIKRLASRNQIGKALKTYKDNGNVPS